MPRTVVGAPGPLVSGLTELCHNVPRSEWVVVPDRGTVARLEETEMEVVAWNNGRHHCSGAGYGIKVSRADRDTHFRKSWKSVVIILPSKEKIEVNTNKKSFWDDTCRELIHNGIGRWMRDCGIAPWPLGHPPKFELRPGKEREFLLEPPSS